MLSLLCFSFSCVFRVLPVLLLLAAATARAQVTYFNSSFGSLPSGAVLSGNASVGGGVVQLVPASNSQQGSLVVNNFTGSGGVTLFDVSFDVFTGNAANPSQPADGYCFAWGAVSGSFDEEGPVGFTGLVVSFDYYVNSPETVREVTVKWNGVQIGAAAYDSYTASTVPVHIRLRHGGYLDVWHNGNRLFTGLELPGFPATTGVTSPAWGFGARTGGATAKVTLDNLIITPQAIGVTSTGSSGAGTLRKAISDAQSTYPGPNQIHFAQELNGQTITLGGSALVVSSQTLAIDASTLADGIVVSGSAAHRMLQVEADASLLLGRVTLSDGFVGSNDSIIYAGSAAIIDGSLEMWDCTVRSCLTDTYGTLLLYSGTLNAHRTTFSANAAAGGGAAFAMQGESSATLKHCTISSNVALQGLGAIFVHAGTCSLDHCTVASNYAQTYGGGIYLQSPGAVTIRNSIISGNNASNGKEIFQNNGTLTSLGGNVIGNNNAIANVFSAGLPNSAGDYVGSSSAPLELGLEPLAANGGYTKTMRLTSSSWAREKAMGSTMTRDQRLLPSAGVPDSGACEYRLGLMGNRTILEDSVATQDIAVGTETNITVESSNATLLPAAGLVVTGSSAGRTVTATPAANQTGTSVITVRDTLSGDTQTFTLTVTPVNDAPTFRKGGDIKVQTGTLSPQTYTAWATGMSAGSADEVSQSLQWLISTTQPALFAAQPALTPDGTLSFTPSPGASGTATVTVQLKDDGGTASGGGDTSSAESFTITIGEDVPRFYSSFGAGLPAGALGFGSTNDESDIRLVSGAATGEMGSMVVPSFTGSETVSVFDVAFEVYTGEALNPSVPADGWCLAVGDVPLAAFGEEGPSGFTGLVVSFDYYVNAPETVREVTVKWNGVEIDSVPYDAYIDEDTVDVHVRLRHGGLLDVWHNDVRLFSSLPLPGFAGFSAPRWGFGARTGGLTATVELDRLSIAPQPLMVTSSATTGPGSLQYMLDKAGTETTEGHYGPDQIHFAAALNGATLAVPVTSIVVGNQTVAIDASTLANGVTLDAAAQSRVLLADSPGGNLFLNRLTLTNGYDVSGEGGGGMRIAGKVELVDTTISHCATPERGGAVRYAWDCDLIATNCTFHHNTANECGGFWMLNGSATLTRCTFGNNESNAGSGHGGGIYVNDGHLVLTHCTLMANTATSASGGGLYMQADAELTLQHCIIAGNTAATRPDIAINTTAVTLGGPNLIGATDDQSLSIFPSGSLIGTTASPRNARLRELSNVSACYTPVVMLEDGSPAISAATGSTSAKDQRGLPMLGTPDLGACEYQLFSATDQTLSEDAAPIVLSITTALSASLSGTAAPASLIASDSFMLGGSGSTRTLQFAPAADAWGSAVISIDDSVSGDVSSFTVTITPVNDAPSFTGGPNLEHYTGNTGLQTQTGWATGISPGPNESSQSVSFTVTADTPGFFSTQPAISSSGTLTYAVNGASIGTTTVRVRLTDDGGTAASGVNVSAESTFTITSGYGWASDFSNGLPPGSLLLDNARVNDGKVRLIPLFDYKVGTFRLAPFAVPSVVTTFDIEADIYTRRMSAANTSGDGWSFALGNLPTTVGFGEEGPANFTGLLVSFDYLANPEEPGKEVSVRWQGALVGSIPYDSFVDGGTAAVRFRVRPGGLLDVWHGGIQLFDGLALPGWTGISQPAWGFGARSGAMNSEVQLDNLVINPQPFVVTTVAASGDGSLVQAVARAAATAGPNQVHFSTAVNGGTINPGVQISIGDKLAIDASTLAGGVTLTGEGLRPILSIPSQSNELFLKQMKLVSGKLTGSSQGAAIYCGGSALLEDCTVSQCSVETVGGAFFMPAATSFTARRCTFSNNSAQGGGVLWMQGSGGLATFDRCTFSGNAATVGSGGCIAALGGTVTLNHCTIAGNTAANAGGGVSLFSPATVAISNCLIASNGASGSPDIYQASGTLTASGTNLIGITSGSASLTLPAGLPNAAGHYVGSAVSPVDPKLGTLGSYGGYTATIPLLSGSLARNTALQSTSASDQRGYGIIGIPDIGAYEAGNDASYTVWAAENSTTATPLQDSADEDADGQTNLAEYAFRSDPRSAGSFGALTQGADGSISFPMRRPQGIRLGYTLRKSSDLSQWSLIGDYQISTSTTGLLIATGVTGHFDEATGIYTFSFSPSAAAADRRFWRVDVRRL